MGKSTANAITLDTIRAEAQRRRPDFVVDGVVFRNFMRMSKAERDEAQAVLKRFGSDDEGDSSEDVGALICDFLRIAAQDAEAAKPLLEAVGEDVTVALALFEMYQEGADLGEASQSQN